MSDLAYVNIGGFQQEYRNQQSIHLNPKSDYVPIIEYQNDYKLTFNSRFPMPCSTYNAIFRQVRNSSHGSSMRQSTTYIKRAYSGQIFLIPFGGLIEFNHFFDFKVLYWILVPKQYIDYQIDFIDHNGLLDHRFAEFHVSERMYDTSKTTSIMRKNFYRVEESIREKLQLPVIVRPHFKDLFWQPELPKDLSELQKLREQFKKGRYSEPRTHGSFSSFADIVTSDSRSRRVHINF